jgi:hypothetical protein
MGKFRKKPVVIEAWQFRPDDFPFPQVDIPDWISLAWFAETIETRDGKQYRGGAIISIPTLEGVMRANPGDWIIRGVKGEVYPCKPDIFEATYEPA